MITRLIGKADGQDIVFKLVDETKGLWETTVPLDLDGTYVVDLTAHDNAGNSSYCATVLFTVDPEKLHVSFEYLKYQLQVADSGYNLQVLRQWDFNMIEMGYSLMSQPGGYQLERGHLCELQ